jgi:hypothetical protein
MMNKEENMILSKENFKALHGYFEGSADAVDKESVKIAMDYKADVCKRYINLISEQIDSKLTGSIFFASNKVDGEMNVLFIDDKNAVIINRSGRVRMGLPCIENAREFLNKNGVKQGVFPVELHVDETAGRTRISDVLNALADKNKTQTLRLAMFDILEINNQKFNSGSYEETHRKITEITNGAGMCFPVKYEKAGSKAELRQIYQRWVEEGGSEGLVVHSELPLIFKIKPRHSIDVVVIGFSEGTGDDRGQIRCLLLAMLTSDGSYQVVGKTGGGFSDEERKDILNRLKPMVVESNFIETDSNHTAFHMVKPEIVIELLISDVIFETTSGSVNNAYLDYTENGYVHKANRRGLSMIYPNFVRFRDDKQAVYSDIRIEQINEFSYIEPLSEREETEEIAKSDLIYRHVYKKETGSKLMVQKFMLWQTNKQNIGYPAYVLYYTNFSSERKDPLQSEIRVSNDREQIDEMFDSYVNEKVKKGWEFVENSAAS